MKILQVIASLRIGGAEKLMTELAPKLRDKGHRVDVLAFDGVDTEFKQILIEKGIKIISFGENNFLYNPINIFRLIRIIGRYDIVHTHITAPQLLCAIASKFTKATLVTTEHNTSNRRREWKWYTLIDRWMYNCYKAVISISPNTEEQLLEFIGRSKSEFVTIYNGINVRKYADAVPSSDIIHPDGKFVVVMVAGFRYQKDHETAIRAFTLLDADKYELWFVGDGERRPIIKDEIRKHQLEGVVKLYGIRSDVPNVIKSANVVLQSSHIEGFGLAAVEGMAAGKPVIATDVPGLSQVVGDAGILVPHNDHITLANQIKKLAEDKDYYNIIATACSARAKTFDIDKMVDGYESVYKRVLEKQ